MHLLGCLFFFLFFLLIFGLALIGSVVNFISRLLFGSRQTTHDSQSQTPPPSHEPAQSTTDYTFQPEDGEYIDYEEVK